MNSIEAIATLEACGVRFSDEQREILLTDGGIDLLAVAGSGKTFTMTNLIAKRMLTGEIYDASKVLCTTFSKAGVEELDTRLNALLTRLRLPSVHVTTLHAACYDILRNFGVRPSKVLSEGEALELLRAAAKENGCGRISQDDLMDLMNTISMQYNALMTEQELIDSGRWTLEIPKATYMSIRDRFQQLKSKSGAIDFDDMQRFVYEWLCVTKYDAIIDWCRARWRWLFIDEFQDTNPVQKAIITAILGNDSPADRLVVVGDDDQCIYEWRGTDPRILINICGDFDLTKRYLSTNYRCPSEIVSKAGACVVNMSERELKSMNASKSGGRLELVDLTSMYNAKASDTQGVNENDKNLVVWHNPICKGSQAVADKILALLNGSEGVCLPKSICVLSRENATMRILSNMMYSKGITVKGQTSMHISSAREWTMLKGLIRLCTKDEMITDVSDIMWQIIPSASTGFGKLISSILVETGCSIDWAIDRLLESCYLSGTYMRTPERQLIAGDPLRKGTGMISIKTLEALKYEISRGIAAESLVEIVNALRVDNSDETLARLLCRARIASEFLYKTKSKKRLFDAYIEYFLSLVNMYGYEGTKQFIRATEQFEKGRFALDNRVELRTIHGAKGGEWNTVFILMDDNLEFPSLEAIGLMQNRGLSEDTINRYIDSERRLHYVAQTRASNTLYIVSELKKASTFVVESMECGGGNDDIGERAKNTAFNNNDSETSTLRTLIKEST